MNNRSRGHVTSKYLAYSWKIYLCLHKTPCYQIPYKGTKFCTEWKAALVGRQALAEGLWKEELHSLCPPSPFSEPWTPTTSALAPSCRIFEEQKENIGH